MTLPAQPPQIHLFAVNGRRFALDVNSGALHLVDAVAYGLLQREEVRRALTSLAPPPPLAPEEGEAWEELESLVRQGTLLSPLPTPVPAPDEQPSLKALCLHVAHDCNLRCAYCFAEKGDFGGERGLMPAEVGRKALEFLVARSGRRRKLAVDFFGGEPLLNFGVVKELLAYAEDLGERAGKEFAFTLTTNGVALTGEILDYLAAHSEINVVLSLDGRPEAHDRWRRSPGGGGSHARSLAHCQAFVSQRGGTNYYVRGTFTKQNLDFSADVEYLLAAGFRSLSLEPVVAKEGPWALSEEDLPRIGAEYDRLAALYLAEHRAGRPFTFYHFNLELFDAPCLTRRLSGCGAGHEYLAVTPTGELFPCHQFVGREGFRMGSVLTGEFDEGLAHRFRAATVLAKPACRECWARFHCSGGCNANHQLFTGSLTEPYALGCALQKKRLECALAVQAELALDRAGAGDGSWKPPVIDAG